MGKRPKSLTVPAVNIQAPWAELIASGKKTIETRFYPLPEKYRGETLAIIETPGKSKDFKKRIIGTVIFSESFCYKNSAEFYSDSSKHFVEQDETNLFGWRPGQKKWGWKVAKVSRFKKPIPVTVKTGIKFTRLVPI